MASWMRKLLLVACTFTAVHSWATGKAKLTTCKHQGTVEPGKNCSQKLLLDVVVADGTGKSEFFLFESYSAENGEERTLGHDILIYVVKSQAQVGWMKNAPAIHAINLLGPCIDSTDGQ